MAQYEVDNYEAALYNTAQRVIHKAVSIGEHSPETIIAAVRDLLVNEAPEGMPLTWVMYIRNVAAALGEDGPDPERQALLRRVGDAIVEAIDEGEVGQV